MSATADVHAVSVEVIILITIIQFWPPGRRNLVRTRIRAYLHKLGYLEAK
jgi:hypothetical protein